MLRFIHTADVHLDAPLQTLSALYELRQDDFRRTMRTIRDLVLDRQADFWLIAGDLLEYHGGRRSTALFLRDLFASVAPVPVCIAPGNHDPWHPDSYYQTLEWPGNVFWFTPEWGAYEFPDKSCVVYGWGFPQPHVYESPLPAFPGRLHGYRHHLMVLHGSVVNGGADGHHPYAPVTLEELAAAGMDYIALGHIHKPAVFLHPISQTPFAAYPGSPEGLSAKEAGERFVILGELDGDGRLRLEHVPVQSRIISRREVDVAGAETTEQLVNVLERELADEGDGRLLYLTLTGERPAHFTPPVEVLEQRLSRFFFVQCTDRTWPDLDAEQLQAQSGVWGRWLSKLAEAEAEAEGADEWRRDVVRMARREALARIGGIMR